MKAKQDDMIMLYVSTTNYHNRSFYECICVQMACGYYFTHTNEIHLNVLRSHHNRTVSIFHFISLPNSRSLSMYVSLISVNVGLLNCSFVCHYQHQYNDQLQQMYDFTNAQTDEHVNADLGSILLFMFIAIFIRVHHICIHLYDNSSTIVIRSTL